MENKKLINYLPKNPISSLTEISPNFRITAQAGNNLLHWMVAALTTILAESLPLISMNTSQPY
jgi:hypothetical protein